MPFINSKSVAAPGSSGGAMVPGPIRDCAIRTRFFGLGLLEEVTFELPMCNTNCRQQSDGALIPLIGCVKRNGRISFEDAKSINCVVRLVRQELIHGTGGYQYIRRSALV